MNVLAKISYFERSVVTLKLRKEYLNTVTWYTSHTPDKILNSLIYRTLFYVNIYRSLKLSKNSRVFWPTLYIISVGGQRHNSCRSWHISVNYDLDLWPLKVIQGQMWWCQTWCRPAAGASPPSCKISAWSCKRSTRCALPNFSLFDIGG